MWAEAVEMLERAERLQQQFFQPGLSSHISWQPPADIFETEDEFHVLIALPGVAPDDVRVGIEAGVLVVAGVRRLPAGARHGRLHRLEIPHGRFERRIGLPSRPLEVLKQELINGCLHIGLHKA
jgi:HSP20 family molecular chaperone IbpA